jgi:hypothetical protein
MDGTERIHPTQEQIDLVEKVVSGLVCGQINMKGVANGYVIVDRRYFVIPLATLLARCEAMAAGKARIDQHELHCNLCEKNGHRCCDVGFTLRGDFKDTCDRATLDV